MTEQKLHTDSALSDRIKECWRAHKSLECPSWHNYYYDEIDCGILFNKEMEIPLEHFDNDLREILDKAKPKVVECVILRAIKEIAQEKFGSRDFSDRIKWRFV